MDNRRVSYNGSTAVFQTVGRGSIPRTRSLNMKNKITIHDTNGKEFEVDTDKLSWRPSVYGVLIENDSVSLSKQFDGYDFPGGGVNLDETLQEACAREVLEETGIFVEVLEPIYCSTSFFNPSHSAKHKNEYWNCPLIYFFVKKVGGEISKDGFDEEEKEYADIAEWVSLDKADQIKYINSVDLVDNKKIINKAKELYSKLGK